VDEVLRALADPSRRFLLDRLNQRNGQTLRELCADLDMARQSVSKHLAVLEAANLVTTLWRGREKLHFLNPAPISEIAERWIDRYDQPRVHALADLKKVLEEPAVDKPAFVYTTYMNTTPKRLWQALTDPAFTQRYWGVTLDTEWSTGDIVVFTIDGVRVADPAQVVLESEPYRRLSYTWHGFTPEWAAKAGRSEKERARMAAEPRSRVAFDIEEVGPLVKLTVIHDGFEADGLVLQSISTGWPQVLSNLKTLLETGDVLPTGPATAWRWPRRRRRRTEAASNPEGRPGPTDFCSARSLAACACGSRSTTLGRT
jgi:DNA-binding transcriptional ArsR family regulator/uncharacterized protein YndB with AHSA1/START domain